jgi:hypothetical protein
MNEEKEGIPAPEPEKEGACSQDRRDEDEEIIWPGGDVSKRNPQEQLRLY